jgi:hypothetical protein
MVAALVPMHSISECLRELMSIAGTARGGISQGRVGGVSHVSVHAARQGESGSLALLALERGLLSGKDGLPWQTAVSLSHSASVRRGASVCRACRIDDTHGESTRGSEAGATGLGGSSTAGVGESQGTDHATRTGESSWFSGPLYLSSRRGLIGTRAMCSPCINANAVRRRGAAQMRRDFSWLRGDAAIPGGGYGKSRLRETADCVPFAKFSRHPEGKTRTHKRRESDFE